MKIALVARPAFERGRTWILVLVDFKFILAVVRVVIRGLGLADWWWGFATASWTCFCFLGLLGDGGGGRLNFRFLHFGYFEAPQRSRRLVARVTWWFLGWRIWGWGGRFRLDCCLRGQHFRGPPRIVPVNTSLLFFFLLLLLFSFSALFFLTPQSRLFLVLLLDFWGKHGHSFNSFPLIINPYLRFLLEPCRTGFFFDTARRKN